MATSSQSEHESDTAVVLEMKNVYSYTIPSFCAIKMELQHAVIRCWVDDVENMLDAFVRVGNGLPSTDRPVPASLLILSGCIVPESEFSQEIVTENLRLHLDGVFVVYDWKWDEAWEDDSVHDHESLSGLSSEHLSTPSPPSPPPSLPATGISNGIPAVTHAVTFKCIGAVRDHMQQLALKEIVQEREKGEFVPVKIEPEPSNPWDSKAIAFMSKIGGTWRRIGYIVHEALDEVHTALENGEILWVKFAWVDFLLQWTNSGPGYYAGINIARSGDWSNTVIKSASTRAYK